MIIRTVSADSGPLGAVPRGVRSVQENPRQTIVDDDGMLSIDTYDLAMIMSELDPMLTQRGKSACSVSPKDR